jgi:uracil-DNA glycosylase family protein
VTRATAAPLDHPAFRPEAHGGLAPAREVAAGCTACDLWARATQTVFGEGTRAARLFMVGEQPGDQEDLAGRPFVGPAGGILADAMADAGMERERVFVTNVVKHFKWKPQGKRRLHERPNAAEIRACRPWLDLELDLVRPEGMVLLGATAATAVLGSSFRLTTGRGEILPAPEDGGPWRLATYHPSAILRAPDAESRRTTYAALVDDLRLAAATLDGGA